MPLKIVENARQKIVNRPQDAKPSVLALTALPTRIQAYMKVSSPRDPAEKEAEATASRIMRMATPESSSGHPQSGGGSCIEASRMHRHTQRKNEGTSEAGTSASPTVHTSGSGGTPLPMSVRRFMEPRFKADFSNVRIHTGEPSATLNRQLNAQAFTTGNQIYFGKDRFKPESHDGRELIAHELTHTIQQGAVIQRSEDVTITVTSAGQAQRFGLSDALDYIADKANYIPGFRMLTIVLGVNPINMSRVERNAANIMRAIIEFLPGGGFIAQALDNHGVFDKVGTWVEQQIRSLGMAGSAFKDALTRFLGTLGLRDLLDPGGVWERAKRIFTEPIDRIISFAKGLVLGIIKFIKDAILLPLCKLAEGTRGYDLLRAVLGQDPITGEPVPRNAETLIGGFMKLIGKEEIWENLKKSNAVPRAWAWFQGAIASLLGFVRQVPSLFVKALQSLELLDIVLVPRAFLKVASVFGGFLLSFLTWAGNALWTLLEIIFDVVAPGVLQYLKKAAGAFKTILNNPIGFVGNLVKAAKLGFEQFASNIGKHLKASLIGWLTGSLGGLDIYIPQSFELKEIIKFVLSVLGLTWQNIRQKLVRVVGETAVKAMETGFDIVMTLVTQGPAAAWEKIKEQLTNLKEIILEEIMSFVVVKVVQSAVLKLVSMLNPAGAILQAIIAIYNTIMFFVERLSQILRVVTAFIDSIAAIAAGVVTAAANRVEQTLAGLLTLAISFLARIAGLGRVSDAVTNIIKKIRAPIDRALDKVVEWIVTMGKKFLGAAKSAAGKLLQWWKLEKSIDIPGEKHVLSFKGDEESAELFIASTPRRIEAFLDEAKKTRTSEKDKRSLGKIVPQVDVVRAAQAELRKLRKAGADESAMQAQLDKLAAAFEIIGTEIASLLQTSDAGTTANPIPLDWPKPAWSSYKPLYLYHLASGAGTMWQLTAKEYAGRKHIKKYFPTGSHTPGDVSSVQPPAELNNLGIKGEFRIEKGSDVGPLSESTTPGGGTINSLLGRFGWSADAEGMDGDHVKEIQFGGKDKLENLWPLDFSTNRGAGSRLSRQTVKVGDDVMTVDLLKKVKLSDEDKKRGKFMFKIRNVNA